MILKHASRITFATYLHDIRSFGPTNTDTDNIVVSHGAQIGGIQVSCPTHEEKDANEMCARSSKPCSISLIFMLRLQFIRT